VRSSGLIDKLASKLTPDHANRIAYLECRLEHEVWHKAVNSFKRSKCFRCIIRGHKLLERRRREPT